jgi:hypothetical protein
VGGLAPCCNTLSASRDLMAVVLESFVDIFTEPSGLPPTRRHDHRIRLLLGTSLVVVQSYRYPQLLNDEIKHRCNEMLLQGIIQECTSSFSSPMLLIKKTDDTWHFCIDYRELNQQTVKDKFSIPVVDELLDELRGARLFTKLELCSTRCTCTWTTSTRRCSAHTVATSSSWSCHSV